MDDVFDVALGVAGCAGLCMGDMGGLADTSLRQDGAYRKGRRLGRDELSSELSRMISMVADVRLWRAVRGSASVAVDRPDG